MKKTVVFMLVVLVICSAMYLPFKREFDQFNPLYKEEYVYAVITKPAGYEEKYDRYRYNLSGYTKQGDKKKVTFSSSKELEQETYVRVLAKGAYTKGWELIQKEDIPVDALK